MAISEAKMKIVIDNYFKAECDVNTSIREAFEKGFRIGVMKGNAVPVVDAVPVVQGRWLGKRYNFKTYETEIVPYDPLSFEDLANLYCSVCGRTALINGHEEEVPSNYCPNCGAKMYLEAQDAR